MKKIYIDSDFKCHVVNDGTMTAVETDFFDGKCDEFIKGYRLVPYGYAWIREDGVEFHGEMIAPWKPYEELAAAQSAWEHEELERLREENERLAAEKEAAEATVATMEVAYQEGVASA